MIKYFIQKRMMLGSALLFLLLPLISNAQYNRPTVFGYVTGQSVQYPSGTSGDTNLVSFNGGNIGSGQHVALSNGYNMAGFKYGIFYSKFAFKKQMFVSKGYFPDYVQLTWELVNFQDEITSFKIFRRELGASVPFEQVANVAKTATGWKDEFAEAGVLYEYKLLADGIYPLEKAFLNTLEGIGFRLPSGKVSGRVTYKGGGAVQDVTIIAETEDDFDGSSLDLNGVSSYMAVSPPAGHEHFKFDNNFTFQTWLKTSSTNVSTIFEKGTQYKITHAPNVVSFTAGGQTISVNFLQKVDTFFQVSAVRSPDSLRLYVMYDEDEVFKTSIPYSGTTTANGDEIFMGKTAANTEFYQGKMDEVRIWYRALPESEIVTKSFMYIAGTEDSLSGYYRLNEGVGDKFYDLSRKGFKFNEKHGFLSNTTWSSEVPLRPQLAVKGRTDANGNYLVSGIPYASDGSTYRIVPSFGIHSFDPTERLLFMGPGSNVYSDINFVDVASFPVTGKIFYKDTRFPVSGVHIKVDGITAVTSEGLPITSDAEGQFVIDVPIGSHQLKLEKYGHEFENGGYFPDSSSKYDFQQPLTIQQNFIDTTLVKVIGKIVGGPVQAAKPDGMGRTTNNIGKSKNNPYNPARKGSEKWCR